MRKKKMAWHIFRGLSKPLIFKCNEMKNNLPNVFFVLMIFINVAEVGLTLIGMSFEFKYESEKWFGEMLAINWCLLVVSAIIAGVCSYCKHNKTSNR
jgi:hypothetical protein